MKQKAYSDYIQPEDIQTRDKITLYNELLLELIVWEATDTPVGRANEAVVMAQITAMYDSMSTDEQTVARQNERRIFRGLHEDNGVIVPSGSEPGPQVGDFIAN